MLYTFVYFVHQYLVLCSGNVSLEELIDNSIDVLYSSKLLTFCDLLSRTIQSYIEYQNHVIMYNVGSSGWHLYSRSCEFNGYCIKVFWGLIFQGVGSLDQSGRGKIWGQFSPLWIERSLKIGRSWSSIYVAEVEVWADV